MNPLIMLSEKPMLIFSFLKIPFVWELTEEFMVIVSHVLGPLTCLRNARLGENSSSFREFLHIYPCTLLFSVPAL